MKITLLLLAVLVPACVVYAKSVVDAKKLIRFIAANAGDANEGIQTLNFQSSPSFSALVQSAPAQSAPLAQTFSFAAPEKTKKLSKRKSKINSVSQSNSFQQPTSSAQSSSSYGASSSYGTSGSSYGGSSYGTAGNSYGTSGSSYGGSYSNGGCNNFVYEYDQPVQQYCICPDGSYGITCTEGWGNPCTGGNQFYPASPSLSKRYFVHCSWNIPYLKLCAPGTEWDQDLLTCKFPDSYYAAYGYPVPTYESQSSSYGGNGGY